ncbi:MAG: YbhB/YbcL family Raf kinase inhibitor-like protein [Roseiarcus sp.]|jgi:Raf kinase inhibitor-like YbhB/YbcL family protein
MRKLAFAAAMLLAGGASGSAAQLTLTSSDIKPGARIADEQVANGFGCSGGNVSPALSWSGAPKGTKSFAISVYDPDAPTGSGFWHWAMFDIPANVTSLPKNAGDPKATLAPAGAIQGNNDAGTQGYFGPCPPKGDKPHHYHLQVFAVDVDKLDADASATPAVVGFNLHFHTLAKATLIGIWGR